MSSPDPQPDLRRVVVVGTSCSGKTTFAKQLADALGSAHVELDALHWLPNWVERPKEEFRKLVEDAATAERWVTDGNYSKARDILWPRATTIVWLNYSFPLILWRAVTRTIRRVTTGEELYAGNRETFRKSFLSHDSILVWVLATFRRNRRRYRELRQSDEWRHLAFVELNRPAQATEYVSQARATSSSAWGA